MLDENYFMSLAIKQAELAFQQAEVPVGAILTDNYGNILAKTHNQTECLNDVTAHAEILAISAGANYLGAKYLKDCTLYVTLEPCVMCAGALYWAQLGRLVYAASDPRRGYSKFGALLHPKTNCQHGIKAQESENLLRLFFEQKR